MFVTQINHSGIQIDRFRTPNGPPPFKTNAIAIDLDSQPREPSWKSSREPSREASNHENTAPARAPALFSEVGHSRGLRPLPPTPRTSNPQELTERASVGVPEEALQASLNQDKLHVSFADCTRCVRASGLNEPFIHSWQKNASLNRSRCGCA